MTVITIIIIMIIVIIIIIIIIMSQYHYNNHPMQINPRWHAQCCKPICDRALGYDATSAAVDAVFNPKKFDALPDIPTPRAAGKSS
jgi:amino acid transporter